MIGHASLDFDEKVRRQLEHAEACLVHPAAGKEGGAQPRQIGASILAHQHQRSGVRCDLACRDRSRVFGEGVERTLDLSELPKALVGAGTTYFIVNTMAIATAIALSTRQSVMKVWNENFLWSAPSYFVGAGAAAIAAWLVIDLSAHWIAPLALAPDHWTAGCPALIEHPWGGNGPDVSYRSWLDPASGRALHVEAIVGGDADSFYVAPSRWVEANTLARV